MSFPRQKKLKTKAEFKNVFAKALKISQKYFLILFIPNQKKYARLGIIVGKRIANHAVTRNNIKRVVRESFRLNTALTGWDIIVMARSQCNTLDKIKLRKGIDGLWERLLIQYQNR